MTKTNIQITLTRKQINPLKLHQLAAKERNRRLKRRILAIALIAEGKLSREAIARKLKTDSDRLREWLRRYNQAGIDGLKDKPGRGDKPTMTAKQEQFLIQALKRSPRVSGINSNIWTGRAVQEFLAEKSWFFGTLGGIYAIIHRLGFTLQKPVRQPLEADPKATQIFLRKLKREKKEVSWRDLPS